MSAARFGIRLALAITLVSVAGAAQAASVQVRPGESIQAAVDAVSPGDTVVVMPGDYVETHGQLAAVRITKSLKLIAKSKLPDVKVRILPGAGNNHGILIEPANPGDPPVEKVVVRGFTVEGFPNNGIYTRYAERFKIIGNESIDNLENGIFPTLSAKGAVRRNVSYGSLDSGLWVEGSEHIRVIGNELYHNPTGLEITVSKNIVAKNNNVHHNTVGIGLYNPAGASLPPLGDDGDWQIIGNFVHDNNFPNPVSGGLVGALPPGIGIAVLGVDRVNIRRNKIVNNGFFGVAIVDWCLVQSCPAPSQAAEYNTVIGNRITGNGNEPTPPDYVAFAPFQSDVFLFAGAGNCVEKNLTDREVFVTANCT